MIERVGILGGGAWGTALALVAARAGRDVILWARDSETVDSINNHRENKNYLPGIVFDTPLIATGNFEKALNTDIVLFAVPAQSLRAIAGAAAPHIGKGTPLVATAKGLERGSGKRMSEVLAESVPDAVPASLSGPSFAADVARRLPTAVTIAAADEKISLDLCRALGHEAFRPYAETDLVGVEIGGAVKNVFAIAAGIVSGRQLGASALAALIARSFAELRRLGEELGARPETLMGLSGLGDLVLTCSSPQSRNFSFGQSIGAGHGMAADHALVEGFQTAAVARDLARGHGVEMPIIESVAGILENTVDIDTAIAGLMNRPLKRETG